MDKKPWMEEMTVERIVRQALIAGGYDGLCSGSGCACLLSDLAPCSEMGQFCVAGYRIPCPGGEECENGGGCEFHISVEKPAIS